MELGDILLWVVLVFGILSIVFSAIQLLFRLAFFKKLAQICILICFVITTVIFIMLLYYFMVTDVKYDYVWSYTHSSYSWYYKLVGVWGGLGGTLLIWTWFISLSQVLEEFFTYRENKKAGESKNEIENYQDTPVLTRKSPNKLYDWVRPIASILFIIFVGLVISSQLFAPTEELEVDYPDDSPVKLIKFSPATMDRELVFIFQDGTEEIIDPQNPNQDQMILWFVDNIETYYGDYKNGFGLNYNLKTPLMIVHPPVEFAAYAFTVIVIAAAFAFLITGSDDWISVSVRWGRWAWLFYTLGLGIGALWAYLQLGWGGYWAWDPVETANLIPWIALTAFLHAQFRNNKRGEYRYLAPVLAVSTFVLTLFSRFVTKTGMWINSVHTFEGGDKSLINPITRLLDILETDPTSYYLFLIMVLSLIISVILISWRFIQHRWKTSTIPRSDFYMLIMPMIVYIIIMVILLGLAVVDTSYFINTIYDISTMIREDNGLLGTIILAIVVVSIPIGWMIFTSEEKEPDDKKLKSKGSIRDKSFIDKSEKGRDRNSNLWKSAFAFAVIAIILLGSALFLPWYKTTFSQEDLNTSVNTENNFKLTKVETEEVTISYDIDDEKKDTINYTDSRFEAKTAAGVFQNAYLIAIAALVVTIIFLAFTIISGKIKGIMYIIAIALGLLACVLSILAPVYMSLSLPEAFNADYVGVDPPGYSETFWGNTSITQGEVEYISTWTPVGGWHLAIWAFLCTNIGSVLLISRLIRSKKPEQEKENFSTPLIDRISMYFTVGLLSLGVLAVVSIMILGVNGTAPEDFDYVAPYVLVPTMGVLIICLIYLTMAKTMGKWNTIYIIGLITAYSIVAYHFFHKSTTIYTLIPILAVAMAAAVLKVFDLARSRLKLQGFSKINPLKIGGVFLIIASVIGMIIWSSGVSPLRPLISMAEPTLAWMVIGYIISIIAFVAGISALKAANLEFVIFGSVCGILTIGMYIGTILSIIALILFLISRTEFSEEINFGKLRTALRPASAHLIHLGIVLLLIGYVTSQYYVIEKDIKPLAKGERAEFKSYEFELVDSYGENTDNDATTFELIEVVIEIYKDGKPVGVVFIKWEFVEKMQHYMQKVKTEHLLDEDIYFISYAIFTVTDNWIPSMHDQPTKFTTDDVHMVAFQVKILPLISLLWGGMWLTVAGIILRSTVDLYPSRRKERVEPVKDRKATDDGLVSDEHYEDLLDRELARMELKEKREKPKVKVPTGIKPERPKEVGKYQKTSRKK